MLFVWFYLLVIIRQLSCHFQYNPQKEIKHSNFGISSKIES